MALSRTKNKKFKSIIKYASQFSKYYSNLFKKYSINVSEIELDKIEKIPITHKSEMPELHKNNLPFGGLLTTEKTELKHIYLSPGPIYDAEGREKDYWGIEYVLKKLGFGSGDIVLNSFSYHLTPAGLFFDNALVNAGCTVFPAGVGNSSVAIQAIYDIPCNAFIGTPSYLYSLKNKYYEFFKKPFPVTKAIVAGEPISETIRNDFNKTNMNVRGIYATAEAGLIGYECKNFPGFHIADRVFVEIVDANGKKIPAGKSGEVVITLLSNHTYPLIRYGTGDIAGLIKSSCRPEDDLYLLSNIEGRVDQTVKIRGMFVYPSAVKELLSDFKQIKRAKLVVERKHERDYVILFLEIESDMDYNKLVLNAKRIMKIKIDSIKKARIDRDDDRLIEDRRRF
ncbi:MAG: phenylacetate--CoA ligase [Epsilonproteobacteria bacterium]|nr:phenylacetate--CoA ligase [Campylobacterota bacterium]